MKKTLSSKYLQTVEPYLNEDGVMAEVSYKRALKSIHTNAAELKMSRAPMFFSGVLHLPSLPQKVNCPMRIRWCCGNSDLVTVHS
jgi:hypothetical protein